jgi:hypothetical protein
MTRHHDLSIQRVVRRLRPSPESVAGAAAVYDPELMLELKALRRRQVVSAPTAVADGGQPSAAQSDGG